MRDFEAARAHPRGYFPCNGSNEARGSPREAHHCCSIGEKSWCGSRPNNADVQTRACETERQTSHGATTAQRKHDLPRKRKLARTDLTGELESGVHVTQRAERCCATNGNEMHVACQPQITRAEQCTKSGATNSGITQLIADSLGHGVRDLVHVVAPSHRDGFRAKSAGVNRSGENVR